MRRAPFLAPHSAKDRAGLYTAQCVVGSRVPKERTVIERVAHSVFARGAHFVWCTVRVARSASACGAAGE